MDFFISNAWAQQAPVDQPSLVSTFVLMGGMFLVFYFLLIRPQLKRAKEHKKLVSALAKGDEIVTNGGLAGTITEVGENFVLVEIANGVAVRVQRHAVASVLPKGTIKNL